MGVCPKKIKRIAAAAVIAAQMCATIVAAQVAVMLPASAASFSCSNAGKDGSPGTLSGTYNTYYAGPSSLTSGATTIPIGTNTAVDTTGGGASTKIATGDLLLIIQMQDGTFTYTNSSSYGTGASIGNAGLFEYVQVSATTTTTATIVGAGSGGGLVNSYDAAAANSSHGVETYQIIVVPQYVSATLSSTFRAAYWDGKTGGVAVLDIASTLNLGGATIYATGDGFRGGAFSYSQYSATSVLNTDYVDSATMNGSNPSTNAPGQGFKGEGIFGTPDYTFGYTTFTTPSTPTGPTVTKATSGNGYPGGDMAMGAPGNAGGGGTDDDPVANDQNTGGGGGSNGGAGGNGGWPWSPDEPEYARTNPASDAASNYATPGPNNNPDLGGRGASAIATGIRAFMGGGGGAGVNNNNSNNNSYSADGSSGGTGGGIVMMRIADTSGSAATIQANGTVGLAPDNDGGGGGGAGGTVIITSPNSFTGITVQAQGAAGTTAYDTTSDTSTTTQHGPGGGGGGGAVYSSSPVSASVTGGANGTTVYGVNNAYGATPGTGGVSNTITYSQIPGAPSGAECYSSTTTGTATLYNGPYYSSETTYKGANLTGTYDGVVTVTNNNDFTAVGMPLANTSGSTGNTGTVPGSPVGGSFTYSTLPTISVEHEFYYQNTDGTDKYHLITFAAQAPVLPGNWNVKICQSNTGGTASACATVTTNKCSATADQNKWVVVSNSATNLDTAEYCTYNSKTTAQVVPYWTLYTPASATYTAFTRYDSVVHATDDSTTPATNDTHSEMYAGYIALTKTANVYSTGCPAGEKPTYASGVCPGGVLEFSIDYRSVVAGAGATATYGTEAAYATLFPVTSTGGFVLSDDGTVATSSSTTQANWATFSSGLKEALYTNLGAANSSCGDGASHCGDSNSGTTYLYYTGIPASGAGSATFGTLKTKFAATIGKQIYPPNFPSQVSSGSVTFAVTVK